MTTTPNDADREAAAKLIQWHNDAASEWHTDGGNDLRFFAADMPEATRKGVWDNHDVIQAFAAHRLASIAPYVEALKEAKDALESVALNCQGASVCHGDEGGAHEDNYYRATQAITKIDNLLAGNTQ